MTAEPAPERRLRLDALHALRELQAHEATIAVVGLLVVTGTVKLFFCANQPLLFDEVWTGVIASQSSLSGLIRQCYLDVGAPLPYLVAWLWAHVAGLSNQALRFPGVLFAAAAPFLAFAPSRVIGRPAGLVWAALLACWLPSFLFATEARSYTLLLFMGTANTIAYVNLIDEPSTKTAFGWTTVSSLLILTHYLALPLVACQGVAFLLIHRLRALRAWPALVAFLPAAASLAVHAAVLMSFSTRSAAGPAPLGPRSLPEMIAFLPGGLPATWVLAAWAAVSLAIWRFKRTAVKASGETSQLVAWVAPATSVAAAGVCLGASLLHPLFIERYLTPMAPGVLLGIALLAQNLGRTWRLAPAALVALQAGLVVALLVSAVDHRPRFSFEGAASALMDAGARRVAFVWNSPSALGGDPDAFAQVGGFFFHRAGRPIKVHAVILKPGEDANATLERWDHQPGAAILWLDQGAAAARHYPRIDRIDPAWRCRDYGTPPEHVIACMRGSAF